MEVSYQELLESVPSADIGMISLLQTRNSFDLGTSLVFTVSAAMAPIQVCKWCVLADSKL